MLAIAGIHTFCAYFGNWQSVTAALSWTFNRWTDDNPRLRKLLQTGADWER